MQSIWSNQSPKQRRIMVVANEYVTEPLCRLIGEAGDVVVANIFADRAGLRLPAGIRCDAVLFQVSRWDRRELLAASQHVSAATRAPILLVCRELDVELCHRARATGILGVLLTPTTATHLKAAIEFALGNAQGARERSGVYSLDLPPTSVEAPVACEEAPLSNRETEVFNLLAQGYRANDIARTLFISSHTARKHTKTVFRKLGLHSQVELMRRYLRRPAEEPLPKAVGA